MDDSTPDAPDARPTTPTGRRRLVLLAVAAVVVVILVIAAILATRGASDDADGTGGGADAEAPAATSSPVTSQDPADGQAPPVEAPAVGLGETAQPVAGLQLADGPGEIAGPALSFDVTVANDTDEAVSLATTVVTVTSGADLVPADQLATGSEALPADVPAGGSATATYVFTVPVERRDDVRITFDYLAGTPAVVFSGQAPRA
jgi:hypothetical protein